MDSWFFPFSHVFFYCVIINAKRTREIMKRTFTVKWTLWKNQFFRYKWWILWVCLWGFLKLSKSGRDIRPNMGSRNGKVLGIMNVPSFHEVWGKSREYSPDKWKKFTRDWFELIEKTSKWQILQFENFVFFWVSITIMQLTGAIILLYFSMEKLNFSLM